MVVDAESRLFDVSLLTTAFVAERGTSVADRQTVRDITGDLKQRFFDEQSMPLNGGKNPLIRADNSYVHVTILIDSHHCERLSAIKSLPSFKAARQYEPLTT